MKKKSFVALLALIVACMLVFAACGDKPATNVGSNADNTTASTEPSAPAVKTDAEKVADYVAAHEEEIKSSFEAGFTAGGLTCTSVVNTSGTGIILSININEFDNLTDAQKATMQASFDAAASSIGGLAEIQKEIPELTHVKILIGEKDGDFVATMTIGENPNESAAPEATNPTMPTETVTSAPTESAPLYSTGSVAYKYTQAGSDDYLAFVFMYDENQNVTEVMYTISGKNLSQEDIDELDEAYDSIEQAKDMGANLNVDLINIDNEHRLDVAILVTGELDVAFVEGMLETDFAGTTIPLAEAEAAVIAQGFVKEA